MTTSEGEAAADEAPVVGPLVGGFFRYPWAATLLMAWTVGVIDGSTWQRFEVFTSNQAGNLVLVGTTVFTDPAAAALPSASLLGAILGVVAGTILGRHFPADAPLRVLAPLILATAMMVVTVVLDLGGAPLPALIPAVSGSLACLATAMVFLPSIGIWITANTGQLLATVQGLSEARPGGWIRGLPFPVRRAVMLTLGFVLGAICSGIPVVTTHALLFGLVPTFFAIGMGFREYWTRRRA